METGRLQSGLDFKAIAISIICIGLFALGYFMVEHVSERENPPLGLTFNIIIGVLLIFLAGIVLLNTVNKFLFSKKKKKKSPPIFLDDERNKV